MTEPRRTPLQDKLLTDDAARLWWLEGYMRGVQSGHQAGYAEAMRVLDEAGAFLAATMPPPGPDHATLTARRTEHRPLDIQPRPW